MSKLEKEYNKSEHNRSLFTEQEIVLKCDNVFKTYIDGDLQVEVLKGINLDVKKGSRIAIIGSSGSGKSTLMHILGGLDNPSGGKVLITGLDINQLNDTLSGDLRNEALGFVYQFHHLMPELTALENVAMPLLIRGVSTGQASQLATEMLDKVGLKQRVLHKPSELSGGERQRAAMARALVSNPSCLLADEPTGNLDSRTAESVFELMLDLNHKAGTSIVIVTHDEKLANKMDQVFVLEDGILNIVK